MERIKKAYYIFAISFIYFLLEITLYRIVQNIGLQKYWGIIPILTYVASRLARKYNRKIVDESILIESSNLLALVAFYCSISNNKMYSFIWKEYSLFSFITCLFLFSALMVERCNLNQNNGSEKVIENFLFNLFYLNTSKTHEIAILIDNKIMKTIEEEQTSEELLKYNMSATYGKKDIAKNEIGYTIEDSSKRRVYENFDVKTTKSIMLRKIYEAAVHNSKEELLGGDLVLFENIELQQCNADDIVMILNVLQDSKIKNQENDDLEINLNKMMERMLDDFTIDYVFKYKWCKDKEKKYIIQLPYKSSGNFENGYQHNDLQLGKLSLIGIYRGEVNFSERDSISSKFLEMIEKSFNSNETVSRKDKIMKLSYNEKVENSFEFKFKHHKLEGQISLIDVIAIIQEINIDSKMEKD